MYEPSCVPVVATPVVPSAISAATIIPVAPPESVIVTFLFVKSIPSSLIIWLSVSTEPVAVESNVSWPSMVSSSNKNLERASVPSASVASNKSVLPKSSFATTEPASEPELSVPSKSKNWLLPSNTSRYLSSLTLKFAVKDCTTLLNSKSKSSWTKKLSSSSCILSVGFALSPISCKTNASNLSVPSNIKLLPSSNTIVSKTLVLIELVIPT